MMLGSIASRAATRISADSAGRRPHQDTGRPSWPRERFTCARLVFVMLAALSLAVVAAGLGAVQTSAQTACTITWNRGAGTDLWTNPNNWDLKRVPTTTDNVCVPDLSGTAVVYNTLTSTIASLAGDENLTISSGSLTLAGSVSTFSGQLTLSGGTLNVASSLTVAKEFLWSGGSKGGGGTLLANGGLKLDGSREDLLAGTVVNAGAGTLGSGTVVINRGATLLNGPKATLAVTGSQLLTSGGSGTAQASFRNEGRLTRADGSPTGILSVSVPFTQTASGTLAFRIGGTTAGTQYDQIKFAGPVALAGTLAASTIGGFEPQTGDAFRVQTYAAPPPVLSPRSSQGGWRPPTPRNSSSQSAPVSQSSMPARTGTAPKALTSHAPVRSLTRAGRAGRRRSITVTVAVSNHWH
jgi:autotransporter-associated beta strand protein